MSGIPIKGSDDNQYVTRTETGEDGQETQVVSGIADWVLRRLFRAISRLTFDGSNQLRAVVAGTISFNTNQTIGTVTTSNGSMGDIGKPATAMVFSRQLTVNGTRRNLIRS